MTLQIEVAPEVESALAAKAARLGVPVERYAAGVLRADVETNGSGGFMAMLADSAPRIADGTLRPLTSNDISGAIADARPTVASRLDALGKLQALAADTHAGWPPIPDEALSSENLYAGRGEISDERKARRLAALEAAVETARGFAGTPGVLTAPLSDFALSRAGAYDAQ
jgi:hypothetical protein